VFEFSGLQPFNFGLRPLLGLGVIPDVCIKSVSVRGDVLSAAEAFAQLEKRYQQRKSDK
jgi:hypothetical protein